MAQLSNAKQLILHLVGLLRCSLGSSCSIGGRCQWLLAHGTTAMLGHLRLKALPLLHWVRQL